MQENSREILLICFRGFSWTSSLSLKIQLILIDKYHFKALELFNLLSVSLYVVPLWGK